MLDTALLEKHPEPRNHRLGIHSFMLTVILNLTRAIGMTHLIGRTAELADYLRIRCLLRDKSCELFFFDTLAYRTTATHGERQQETDGLSHGQIPFLQRVDGRSTSRAVGHRDRADRAA